MLQVVLCKTDELRVNGEGWFRDHYAISPTVVVIGAATRSQCPAFDVAQVALSGVEGQCVVIVNAGEVRTRSSSR